MKAICPNCGSDEIVGADRIAANAMISHWELDDGAPRPVWSGNTEVCWDTQAPELADKPYGCVGCDTYYAASGLKFEQEAEDADA